METQRLAWLAILQAIVRAFCKWWLRAAKTHHHVIDEPAGAGVRILPSHFEAETDRFPAIFRQIEIQMAPIPLTREIGIAEFVRVIVSPRRAKRMRTISHEDQDAAST